MSLHTFTHKKGSSRAAYIVCVCVCERSFHTVMQDTGLTWKEIGIHQQLRFSHFLQCLLSPSSKRRAAIRSTRICKESPVPPLPSSFRT